VDKPHWAFNFEQYTPATLLPKKYADDKLQDKTDNVLITTDKTITGAIFARYLDKVGTKLDFQVQSTL
ncbi:hypothetical protein, partial [Spiroplasma sp. AdecLV25b]|uniref:hypothetical protein n=1 Tax=Spiroplasma sp. AdecLV25b TaxID=3027162 RepID=UPI0027E0A938